jgi:hypothetical protein
MNTPTPRPTPETDAVAAKTASNNADPMAWFDDMIDHARTLERQRDELAEVLEHVLGSAHPNLRDNPAMFGMWEIGRHALANLKRGEGV